MRDRKGLDPDGKKGGEKLGRAKGEETIIGVYYMEKNLFLIKEI